MTDKRREAAKAICLMHNMMLSPDNFEDFVNILEPMYVLRGRRPVEKGEVCDYLFYIERGLIIQYYDKNGQQVIQRISIEGDLVINAESYFMRTPSEVIVEVYEPVNMYGIPYDRLFELSSRSYEICRLIFAIQQRALVQSLHDTDSLRYDDAATRYAKLQNASPEIVRRTPLRWIASHLQMSRETLSRVRSAYAERK